MIKFNIHSLPFLLTSIFSLFIPLFIFIKNKRSRLTTSFLILGLNIAFWQFPYFIMYNLTNKNYILFLIKLAYVSLVFVSTNTYRFIISFLNIKRKIIYIFYALSFLFLFFVIFTEYIVSGFKKFPFGYIAKTGNYYPIFLITWLIPLIYSFRELYIEYKKAIYFYEKRRIKYIVITLTIGYFALLDTFVIYGFNLYPFGFVGLITSIILITYGILNYRILDTRIQINKLSLYIFLFIIFVNITYISLFYFKKFYLFIYPLIIVLFFRFIFLIKKTQEEEFKKRFLYKSILKTEIERIVKAKDLRELTTYFIRDLSSNLNLESAGIFILDKEDKFILNKSIRRSKNIKRLPSNIIIYPDNPIITLLKENKKPIIKKEIEYYINNKIVPIYENRVLSKVLNYMNYINSEIIIGGFFEEKLLTIIAIGNKLNKESIYKHDIEMLTSIANAIAQAVFDFGLREEKIKLIVASQNVIINAIEAKDSYTKGHTERVTNFVKLIAEKIINLNYKLIPNINDLMYSAQLHDVGKIGIKDYILLKNGPLTEEEYFQIKKHPLIGFKIIEPVKEWLGKEICDGILFHHENYNGSGYPSNKKGQEIPISAKIIRVADSFDAMVSDRPYRKALNKDEAILELDRYKNIYYDPIFVKALEDLYLERKI